jgi:hypothetical protein
MLCSRFLQEEKHGRHRKMRIAVTGMTATTNNLEHLQNWLSMLGSPIGTLNTHYRHTTSKACSLCSLPMMRSCHWQRAHDNLVPIGDSTFLIPCLTFACGNCSTTLAPTANDHCHGHNRSDSNHAANHTSCDRTNAVGRSPACECTCTHNHCDVNTTQRFECNRPARGLGEAAGGG